MAQVRNAGEPFNDNLHQALLDQYPLKFSIIDPETDKIYGAISAGSTPFGDNALEIHQLGTQAHGQGFGTALLDEIKKIGRESNKDLVTFPSNEEAKQWWMNQGAMQDEGSDLLRFERGKYALPLAAGAGLSALAPGEAEASPAELLKSLHKLHPERMKRAEQQGFDTSKIYYHGTNKDIDSFRIPNKHETSFQSLDEQIPWIYGSSDPEHASEYADVVAYLRDGDRVKWDPEVKSGANVIPYFVKGNTKTLDGEGETFDFVYPKMMSRYGNEYDNLLFTNVDDPAVDHMGASGDVLASKNPKNIRSIFANFDPKKINSSDILAASLPAALAVSPSESEASTIGGYFEPIAQSGIADSLTNLSEDAANKWLDLFQNPTENEDSIFQNNSPMIPIGKAADAAFSTIGIPELALLEQYLSALQNAPQSSYAANKIGR